MPQTWFITGASRGLGAEIADAALRAGHRVVATGRRRDALVRRLGTDDERLLALELDVADTAQAEPAVTAALARFGGIDVLVNNAGYGHLGHFEETDDADARAQFATNVFGLFAVTRAVLPAMRRARRGHVVNVSSSAGFRGIETGSLYSASKFAVEGFSESLALELAPFGIHVTLLEPGPFRTEFFKPASIRFGGTTVADYDARRAARHASFLDRDGRQPGDPARLAQALLRVAEAPRPPLRFVAGAQAIAAMDAKLAETRAELDRWRTLGASTDFPAGA